MATGAYILSLCHLLKGEVSLINTRDFKLRETIAKPIIKFLFSSFPFQLIPYHLTYLFTTP
jgi:hypothetical protein